MTILTVDVRLDTGHPIMYLTGELDVNSAPTLRDAMETALMYRPHLVEVDTAALTFCDSEGLRTLLHIQRAAVQVGSRLRLSHVQGVLRRVLDITQLSRAFAIDPVQVSR